jgi:hypothetical protein
MSTNERIKRPPLERTGPVRNWSTLLGAPSMADAARFAADATANGANRAGLGDVVSRSVELGYRVVDEYVRQGQRAARRFSEGAARPEQWAGDAQDLGQRMAQYASELVGTWFELLERSNLSPAAAAPTAAARAAAPSGPAAAPGATAALAARLRVAIDSTRPAEVFVELAPEATGNRFVVHALRACEAWKPRIDEVEFRADGSGEPPALHVRIPTHHPPGAYEGLIVDEVTNRPVGVVRVCLRGTEPSPG